MKKIVSKHTMVIFLILGLVSGLILNASISPAAASSEKVITLAFQGKWEGHEKENWASEQMKLKDYVAEATNGKIQIKNMNEVVKDNEVIDAVRQGVVDMGCQPLFLRRELIAVNFLSLPFVPHKKMPDIMEKLKPVYEDIWSKAGVKQLGYVYFLPQNLYTKEPADTFEALKGMKIRVLGNTMTTLFKDAGATPINMTHAEVYTSLQRGLIDGAQTALPGYISGALYESCKYLSAWPLGGAGMGVVMNVDSWNKLGPELQKQFMSAFQKMEKGQFEGIYKDVANIEAKAKELGGIRRDPPQVEQDKLLAYVGAVLEDWKKKSGPTSTDVLKAINEVLGTSYK